MHQPTTPILPAFTSGRAVFRDAAHQFVGLVGRGGHLAAIHIDGENHITLRGEFPRLFFHLVVQTPPFVNGNQSGMLSAAVRQREIPGDSFVSAGIRDHLRSRRRVRGWRRHSAGKKAQRQHGEKWPSPTRAK